VFQIHSSEFGGMRTKHRPGGSDVTWSVTPFSPEPVLKKPWFSVRNQSTGDVTRGGALSHLLLQPVYRSGWGLRTLVCLYPCYECYGTLKGQCHVSLTISAESIPIIKPGSWVRMVSKTHVLP